MTKPALTEGQRALLSAIFASLPPSFQLAPSSSLSEKELLAIAGGELNPVFLTDKQLLLFLVAANGLYRGGLPIISDHEYDFTFLAELRKRNPDHPFLHSVEVETQLDVKTVELPARMLSTDKAYDFSAIERWGKRVQKAAEQEGIDFSSLIFRATPKLDGFAAYDDGKGLYTRGDGRRGTDVSRVFERGLKVAGDGRRGLGPGEIVVNKDYFAAHLAEHFDNSRNIQASLLREAELDPLVETAVIDGAAVFFPFSFLPDWQGDWQTLVAEFTTIVDTLWHKVPYDIDGVVFEITLEKLKEAMGATMHHHRWQIAFKRNTESAQVRVVRVVPQTSRSGRINPVAEVEPTRLSGAEIRRVTVHHYGMVREKGVGAGCLVELTRSGEVIPKIERVIEPVEDVSAEIPVECPSCHKPVVWEDDYLRCHNSLNCPAQITHSLEYFFKTLGNIDGFGPSSIQKLYDHGIISLPKIYAMTALEFEQAGFGPKQSENMFAQLVRSRRERIEDSRFLAAFGLPRLGRGNCEKLLQHFPLEQVFALARKEIVANIHGFQEKTAESVCAGLSSIKELFFELYGLGFNLERTPLLAGEDKAVETAIAGETIVFTGKMKSGSRSDMEREVKALGAEVGKSITGKTSILVTGANVGSNKVAKAKKLGVKIISEADYRSLLER